MTSGIDLVCQKLTLKMCRPVHLFVWPATTTKSIYLYLDICAGKLKDCKAKQIIRYTFKLMNKRYRVNLPPTAAEYSVCMVIGRPMTLQFTHG